MRATKRKRNTDNSNYDFSLDPIPLAIVTIITTGIFLFLVYVLQEIAFHIVKSGNGLFFLFVGGCMVLVLRFFILEED